MTEIALITCTCPANTGKLAEKAGTHFRLKNPSMVDELMTFKNLGSLKYMDEESSLIVVLQGCENNCPLKRLEKEGIVPNLVLKACELGYKRDGTADPSYSDLEIVAGELKKRISSL
ncbi:MAG TPA: hypothetical protein O0W90_01845 [Methanocorpusculum sp.]|nr:hypothetical protein [Methanocorpusculum sp.]